MQCSIPVFEGLLPEPHNTQVLTLLYHFGHWHGLAKLRLHTDETLAILDNLTTVLGNDLRTFKVKTCAAFKTKELQREADARRRRRVTQVAKAKASPVEPISTGVATQPDTPQLTSVLSPTIADNTSSNQPTTSTSIDKSTTDLPASATRRPREFNMNTYKTHALGDYVETIRQYGTTDSYSTELVSESWIQPFAIFNYLKGELEHRNPKGRYKRTSKKQFKKQLAQIERRQARLRRIRQNIQTMGVKKDLQSSSPTDLSSHHHIGVSENLPQHIGCFIQENQGDPATKASTKRFTHLLKTNHFLVQIAFLCFSETTYIAAAQNDPPRRTACIYSTFSTNEWRLGRKFNFLQQGYNVPT